MVGDLARFGEDDYRRSTERDAVLRTGLYASAGMVQMSCARSISSQVAQVGESRSITDSIMSATVGICTNLLQAVSNLLGTTPSVWRKKGLPHSLLVAE